jgi:hypothetical protein
MCSISAIYIIHCGQFACAITHGFLNIKILYKLKNVVFWNVTPCGSCKNRHFRGTIRVTRIGELGTTVAVTSNLRTLRRTHQEKGSLNL